MGVELGCGAHWKFLLCTKNGSYLRSAAESLSSCCSFLNFGPLQQSCPSCSVPQKPAAGKRVGV